MSENNEARLRGVLAEVSKAFDDGIFGTHYAMTAEEMNRVEDIYHKVKDVLSETEKETKSNALTIRNALEELVDNIEMRAAVFDMFSIIDKKTWLDAKAALALPLEERKEQREGEWLNGDDNEYEFAYCSVCGRMQYADWNSHAEAKEKIGEFHKDYQFCPGCGAKMVGGRYHGK